MAAPRPSLRPLQCVNAAIRQCRYHRPQRRWASTASPHPATKHLHKTATRFDVPLPDPIFFAASKQPKHRKISVVPSLPSYTNTCRSPLQTFTSQQLSALDPSGSRTRLFSATNPDGAKPGDILLVRQAGAEPFAGVCLSIRRRGHDTAVLLRNTLTRVGVEMWFKIYSPNVTAVEIVQRREKRARRARLYYMRKPKHDIGSVDGIVRTYLRKRAEIGSKMAKSRKGVLARKG